MSNTRNLENNLVKIIAAIAFLIFAYFAIQIFSNSYTQKLTQKLSGPGTEMNNQLKEQVSQMTDAYAACKLGLRFSQAQNNDLALFAFQKATDLDPTYRDGWVLRGWGELKMNQPQEAIISLKKAEEIDPINARTYELLNIAYTQTGDTDNAKKAEDKYDYLNKNSD